MGTLLAGTLLGSQYFRDFPCALNFLETDTTETYIYGGESISDEIRQFNIDTGSVGIWKLMPTNITPNAMVVANSNDGYIQVTDGNDGNNNQFWKLDMNTGSHTIIASGLATYSQSLVYHQPTNRVYMFSRSMGAYYYMDLNLGSQIQLKDAAIPFYGYAEQDPDNENTVYYSHSTGYVGKYDIISRRMLPFIGNVANTDAVGDRLKEANFVAGKAGKVMFDENTNPDYMYVGPNNVAGGIKAVDLATGSVTDVGTITGTYGSRICYVRKLNRMYAENGLGQIFIYE